MNDYLLQSGWVNSKAKRSFDVCLVIVSAPFISILLLVLMVLIVLVDWSWPLFCQWRVGKGGAPFRFYKLNTMGRHRSVEISGGSGDKRATRLGRVLRWLILDEVPQIMINVIKGEMSLVGPRPLLQADIELMRRRLTPKKFATWYYAYCSVRPGWTGRFGISSRRFQIHSDAYLQARRYYDIMYVKQASWRMDIWTICAHAILPFIDQNYKKERIR